MASQPSDRAAWLLNLQASVILTMNKYEEAEATATRDYIELVVIHFRIQEICSDLLTGLAESEEKNG